MSWVGVVLLQFRPGHQGNASYIQYDSAIEGLNRPTHCCPCLKQGYDPQCSGVTWHNTLQQDTLWGGTSVKKGNTLNKKLTQQQAWEPGVFQIRLFLILTKGTQNFFIYFVQILLFIQIWKKKSFFQIIQKCCLFYTVLLKPVNIQAGFWGQSLRSGKRSAVQQHKASFFIETFNLHS